MEQSDPICVVCKAVFHPTDRYKWILLHKYDPTLLVYKDVDTEGVCQACIKAVLLFGFSEIDLSKLDPISSRYKIAQLYGHSVESLKANYLDVVS